MSIFEVDMFTGLNKVETSIKLIREQESVEGYQVCLSAGGKDNQVVFDLTIRAEAKHDLVYNRTGIDPPEALYFMLEHYPNVIISKPEMSIWLWIEKKGLPRRQARWCCEKLKETSGYGRTLITGIRAEESARRKTRQQVEDGRFGKKKFVHPIFYWTETEVWEYIDSNGMEYCQLYDIDGWDRLGCILCPFTSWRRTLFEWQRYPKIAEAWFRAAKRYYEKGTPGVARYSTWQDFVWCWLTRGEVSVEVFRREAENRGLQI